MSRKRTDFPEVPVHDPQVRRVRQGETVRVDFMAWLEDGTLIDSSIYNAPPTFPAWTQSLKRIIERLAIGMSVGESKTEMIAPDSAFGPYHPELSCQVNRSWFHDQKIEPQVGLGLEVRKTDGTLIPMIVTGLTHDHVTLDANHPLAGKDLLVQLDLLEILDRAGSGVHATPSPKMQRTGRFV